jgi:DNA-binding GntR family transcriptional regulator
MSSMSTQGNSIVPATRAEAVASELRRLIQAGELTPGTHLRQAEIAERFGMSTTPVREAFLILAREGIVRQDAHRGVVVFKPTVDELTETFEIREALEGLAAELAAKELTEEELEAIEAIVERMGSARPARYIELNADLHRRINQGAGRARLLELIEQLRDLSWSYIYLNVRRYDDDYRQQVQEEHEAIVGALRQHEAKAAGRLVRGHIHASVRHLADLLEEV